MAPDRIYLLPGPTQPCPQVLQEYAQFRGSSDLSVEEFARDYDNTTALLGNLLHLPTSSSVVIMSGEGMLSLWAGLSSCLVPDDRVLAINSGLYGKGIGEMARGKGAALQFFDTDEGQVFTLSQHWDAFEAVARAYQPHMITLVHCETPSGTLVPRDSLEKIGALCAELQCLFYVDMVSSAGGTAIDLAQNQVDLALLGSQKCFGLHSDLSILAISSKAWSVIEAKKFSNGYDALLPWRQVVRPPLHQETAPTKLDRLFPYTMNWSAIMALQRALTLLQEEGWENVYARHAQVAQYCRARVLEMGLQLHVAPAVSSPTVTAICVPDGVAWADLSAKLQAQGVFLGRNYGDLAGKVFRVGHMGPQAQQGLVQRALDILQDLLPDPKTK